MRRAAVAAAVLLLALASTIAGDSEPYAITSFAAGNLECSLGGKDGRTWLRMFPQTVKGTCVKSPHQDIFPGYYELFPRTSLQASDMTARFNCSSIGPKGCKGCNFELSAVPIAQCVNSRTTSLYLQPQSEACFGGSTIGEDVSNASVTMFRLSTTETAQPCDVELATSAISETFAQPDGKCVKSVLNASSFNQIQWQGTQLNVKIGCNSDCTTCEFQQDKVDLKACLKGGSGWLSFLRTETISTCALPNTATFDRGHSFRNHLIIICVSVAAAMCIVVGSFIWCRRRRQPVYQELE